MKCCGGMQLVRETTNLIVDFKGQSCISKDDNLFSIDYCPFCGKKLKKEK